VVTVVMAHTRDLQGVDDEREEMQQHASSSAMEELPKSLKRHMERGRDRKMPPQTHRHTHIHIHMRTMR
jgi:hypothetical protein